MFFCSHKKPCLQVFPKKFTIGGIYKRTIRHCLPYCFLEIFVGGKSLDEGEQGRDKGIPTRENPGIYLNSTGIEVLRYVVCFMFQATRFIKNEEGHAIQWEFTNNAIQI